MFPIENLECTKKFKGIKNHVSTAEILIYCILFHFQKVCIIPSILTAIILYLLLNLYLIYIISISHLIYYSM
jgi:hypothetical protein